MVLGHFKYKQCHEKTGYLFLVVKQVALRLL